MSSFFSLDSSLTALVVRSGTTRLQNQSKHSYLALSKSSQEGNKVACPVKWLLNGLQGQKWPVYLLLLFLCEIHPIRDIK